ncbi:unnamed protein product [Arctogadus glacialis]
MMDTIVYTQASLTQILAGLQAPIGAKVDDIAAGPRNSSPLVGTAECPVPTSSFSVHTDRRSQVSRGVLCENRERARRSPNESCQSSAALNPGP